MGTEPPSGNDTRHYAYRLDHDTGFAPHLAGAQCTLCGCKVGTIERWAGPGSWVVGIGGQGTHQPDKLIYAMQVDSTPSLHRFRRMYPDNALHLRGRNLLPSAKVLVSTHFYYFGDAAPALPASLARIIHSTQGCKRLTDLDIEQLRAEVLDRYGPGCHGQPNTPEDTSPHGTCDTSGCERRC